MSHKPVVMWDIDGVLANFMQGFLRLAKTTYPWIELPSYHDGNHPSWNTAEKLLSKEQVSHVWDRLKASHLFWRSLPVLPTVEERREIRRRAHDYDYIFITNRMGVDAKWQTEWWLRYYLKLTNPTVILSDQKGRVAAAVGAQIGIEDKVDNAINMEMWGVKPYLIARPYNEDVPENLTEGWPHGIFRVGTTTEFLHLVDEFYGVGKEAA